MKRVPSYRLHKPSGRAVVTLNGKDHYLGEYGSAESREAYNRLLLQWESAGRSLSFGSKPTVAMIAADYVEFCKTYYPDRKYTHAEAVRYNGQLP